MIYQKLVLFILVVSLFGACASKISPELPHDVLGIRIGMDREEAQRHLEKIGAFERDERKRQQVWRVKADPHFNYVAVGYDEFDKIRYVTAFVDAKTATERIRFSEVGDLAKATQEIISPHYRYIWEASASDEKPGYQINVYGDNSEFLTTYSLAKIISPDGTIEESDK